MIKSSATRIWNVYMRIYKSPANFVLQSNIICFIDIFYVKNEEITWRP